MSDVTASTPSRPRRLARPGDLATLAGLSGAGWIALWIWGTSPYARYLGHDHQPAAPAGQLLATAVFVAGWVLMITAMMLPATRALGGALRRVARARTGWARLHAAMIFGFVGAWLAVGLVFRVADAAVHVAVDRIPPLAERPAVVAGAALVAAGSYQLMPLKARCLAACRSPRGFLIAHWTGGHPGRDAVRIGTAFGWSCVGCCWPLMVVMLAVGSASLAWMAAIGLAIGAERALSSRWRLTPLLGVILLLVGGLTTLGLFSP